MNKKISLGVTLTLILVAMAVTVSATVMVSMRYFSGIVNDVTEQQALYGVLSDVDKVVRENYSGTIKEEELQDALAKAYAAGYGDPYAAYYTAEEYKVVAQLLQGSYTGFGLEVIARDGVVIVTEVYANSAAAVAGIQKQDVITAIDEKPVTAANIADVNAKLRTASNLLVSISRGEIAHSYSIAQSTIVVENVVNSMLKDGVTGYIRLRSLSENAFDQVRSAVSALKEEGATRFLLDLRDNTGGSIEAAQSILGYLLPRGTYARLNVGEDQEPVILSSHAASQMIENVVVLVNENTAAEAELIAGALREAGGMKLVGVTTNGHADLQSYFTLASSGAAVRVPVGTLELIKGGSWEGKGLAPDTVVTLTGDRHFSLRSEGDDDQIQAALALLGSTPTPETTTTATGTDTTGTDTTGTGTQTTGTQTTGTGSTTAATTTTTTRK